jgi:hypothetical protein
VPDYQTGYWDEAALRGIPAPTSGPAPATGWYGQIGNSTMYLGGLNADATPEQAAAYYGSMSNSGMTHGMVDPSVFDAANPNATQAERDAYTKQYESTQRQQNRDIGGVGRSLHDAASFELDHIGNIFEGLVDEPSRLVFGFDPLGTKIGETVTGREYDPLVNQMGGATRQQIADYEAVHGRGSSGGAQGLHDAAAGTAGIIAAGTMANGGLTGGQGGGSNLYTMTPAEQAQITGGLTNVPAGVQGAGTVGFGGAGTGGLPADLFGSVQGTQLGAAGNGLVLQGGAGTIGGSWLPYVTEYGPKVAGLANQGGGGGGGGAAPAAMPQIGGMMGSVQQPAQAPRRQQAPLNQQFTRYRGYGRTPLQFRGQTVWL